MSFSESDDWEDWDDYENEQIDNDQDQPTLKRASSYTIIE